MAQMGMYRMRKRRPDHSRIRENKGTMFPEIRWNRRALPMCPATLYRKKEKRPFPVMN